MQGKLAAALDPLSPQVLVNATLAYMFKGDFERARALAKSAHDLDPSFFFPIMLDGWTRLEESKPQVAIASLSKAASKADAAPFVRAYLAYAYGSARKKAAALAQLDTLKNLSGSADGLPFIKALVFLWLGDKKQALDNLELALAADSQMMAWIGQDHIFDSLRAEPRFRALLTTVHFAN